MSVSVRCFESLFRVFGWRKFASRNFFSLSFACRSSTGIRQGCSLCRLAMLAPITPRILWMSAWQMAMTSGATLMCLRQLQVAKCCPCKSSMVGQRAVWELCPTCYAAQLQLPKASCLLRHPLIGLVKAACANISLEWLTRMSGAWSRPVMASCQLIKRQSWS